jgi:hypothetical protein
MLNFDLAPAGMPIGPLHAIFRGAGQALGNFQADALLLQAQLSVQQAAGPYLDRHGLFYSVARKAGEPDEPYRARILLAIHRGKLTLAAIQSVVTLYYLTASAYPTTVTDYDLQSQPALAAALVYPDPVTGAPTTGIKKLDFVIAVVFEIPASLAFFAGRSYAGRNSYLISADPYVTNTPADPNLVAEVRRTKAGGTHPIYSFRRDIQAHV